MSGLSWARSSSICRGSIGCPARAGSGRRGTAHRRRSRAFSPRPSGACGISTAAPSQPQAATIAAAASANSAAAMRIELDFPRTAPPRLRLSCAPDVPRRQRRRAVRLAARPVRAWSGLRTIIRSAPIGGRAAGCFNHAHRGRLDECAGNAAAASATRRIADRIRSAGGEQRPSAAQQSERPWSCQYAYRRRRPGRGDSCCLRRPRHLAQSADPKAGDPAAAAEADAQKDGQRKIDEFAEAAKLLGGPAANPECVWLGRRVVSLLGATISIPPSATSTSTTGSAVRPAISRRRSAAWSGRATSIRRPPIRLTAGCTPAGSIRASRPTARRPPRRRAAGTTNR